MSMTPEEGKAKLTCILTKIQQFLQREEYYADLKDELSKKLPNYMTVLENRRRDIIKKDSSIVITGETSAGKSTLINCLLGEKIFAVSNVAATGKICRIRNSTSLACKFFTKQEQLVREKSPNSLKELKKIIKKGTDIEFMSEEDKKNIYFVDVFLPFPMLEGGVIIVDTPGIGENKELNTILLDFLPDAVSFVFLVNARNAGGVQEGRLLDILETIIRNRDKMPCFNPKEVLFVTNQWDAIEKDMDEDDDDSEDEEDDDEVKTESDKERTWRIIREKLFRNWNELDEENIFRVALKQVHMKRSEKRIPEYYEEYKRFLKFLDKTIKKNVHIRLKNHFGFLEVFMHYAETGTLARLDFLSKSEEDKQKEIEKSRAEINALETECKMKRKQFVEDLDSKLERLAEGLWKFLTDPSNKWKILNPSGWKLIQNVPYDDLDSEIPKRIEEGVKTWCAGSECKRILEDTEKKFQEFVKEMGMRFRAIGEHITGRKAYDSVYNFATGFGVGVLVSFTFAVGALFSIVFVPVFLLIGYFLKKSQERHREKVDEIFGRCIQDIKKDVLKEKFAESFGKEYEDMIKKVFDEQFPNEINAFRVTLDNLVAEQEVLKGKEKALTKLHRDILDIQQEMNEMRFSLSKIIDN